MIKFIIRHFIKNSDDLTNQTVRKSYGVLGGVLGTICNLLLFALKLGVGMVTHSIAVISDAFNNLSDLGSSLISVVGSKLSDKSADSEHPYGHGRAEYISALIISFLIILFGVELFKSSLDGIINPSKPDAGLLSIGILIFSILIKLWMWYSNKYMGKQINSAILLAAAKDSLNDSIATSAVVLSTVVSPYVSFSIDGIAGLCVSLLIFKTGIDIAKKTVGRLLGVAPSEELIQEIETILTSNQNVLGMHGLMVHDYGPGRTIASVHAEVPDNLSLVEVHNIIDKLEHKILDELQVDIVIHMDPIPTKKDYF